MVPIHGEIEELTYDPMVPAVRPVRVGVSEEVVIVVQTPSAVGLYIMV